jgi:hypothetical protein
MDIKKMIVHQRNKVFENLEVYLQSHFGHLDIQIMIGSMCYSADEINQLKRNGRLILFNIEQIDPLYKFSGVNRPVNFIETFKLFDEIWDYDPINIERLNKVDINDVKFLPFNYTKELRRYIPDAEEEIDILFYGSLSPLRRSLINKIKEGNPNRIVKVTTGLYGSSLDEMLRKSKIVLNCHYIEWADIQEQTRIFYPLINGTTVVSEYNNYNHYGNLIYNEKREDIPSVINKILSDDTVRKNKAFEASLKFKEKCETFDWSIFK